MQDGVIPRTRFPQVLRRIEELGVEYGLRVANVFHAGDGNLHPLVLYDDERARRGGTGRKAGRAHRRGLRGGGRTLTGEHVIGVDKER